MQLVPGINKESTNYGNEGGWYHCDKVRFRSGNPEKIGGWTRYSANTYIGTARNLHNWIDNDNSNWLSVGTSEKFYAEEGGKFNDITPIRQIFSSTSVPALSPTTNNFTTSTTSTLVTVNIVAHGAIVGDYVSFGGVSGANAILLNEDIATSVRDFVITTIIDLDHFTINLATNALSTGANGGSGTIAFFQLVNGLDVYVSGTGWGAGAWGISGWGASSETGGIGQQLRLWSADHYGRTLLFNPRGGDIYYWDSLEYGYNTIFPRATTLLAAVINENLYVTPPYEITHGIYPTIPSFANYLLVTAQRMLVLFGTNEYGDGSVSNMLVRWSDQQNIFQWKPDITNQTGEYKLTHGSQIIQAVDTRQETLIFTDSALYSMRYQGPPYVFGFNLLMDNISIMSPNSAYTVNGVTYWMGLDKFYMYSGTVETLPCTVKQYVFEDMNTEQSYQFFVGGNSGYNEVWWFYCSEYVLDANGDVIIAADGSPIKNTKINKYVIFNYLDRTWYVGTMARTAWLDSGVRKYPMAATYTDDSTVINYGRILYHESSIDDVSGVTSVPINAYINSSEFDIDDGQQFGFIWRVLPDVNFNASTIPNPKVYISLLPRRNSGNPYGTNIAKTQTTSIPIQNVGHEAQKNIETLFPKAVVSGNDYSHSPVYTIQEFTGQVYTRVRGRQCTFKISSKDIGVAWQLGAVRLDTRTDGRR